MEERGSLIEITRYNDPEKLVVLQAESLKDQIRFYINRTQYVAAIEDDEGCIVRIDEKVEEKNKGKRKRFFNKKKLKELIVLVFVSIVIYSSCFMGLMYMAKILNNTRLFFCTIYIVHYVMRVVNVIVIGLIEGTPSIKSKHSAEHMMVNFLEFNRRLPKNIDEVKKFSRFSPECGSRKLIEGDTEEFIQGILAALLAFLIGEIVAYLFHNEIAAIIVLIVSYVLMRFLIVRVISKSGKLNFIINPINRALTKIIQYTNTTRKVKDKDIILAYSAAEAWIQIVYPEFYNMEEDVFWKQYFEG